MRRSTRFENLNSQSLLARALTILICFCLLLSMLAIGRPRSSSAEPQGPGNHPNRGGKGNPPRPIKGPPGIGLPNTDVLLQQPRPSAPLMQGAIPSTQPRYRNPRLSNRPKATEPNSASEPGAGDDRLTGASRERIDASQRGRKDQKRFGSVRISKHHVSREAGSPISLSTTRQTAQPLIASVGNKPTRAIPPPQNPFDFPAAMLDPHNRTGASGEDLLSGNFHWALGILGLSGRAGLDLDLDLSYNSLATWVRSGNFVDFDYDNGFPTPGFRLAFPVVDGSIYYNSQAGAYYYLLLTSSGSRVELRRVAGTSNVYEAVDSSYLQLTDYGSYLLLRSADGSQFKFYYSMGQYRCTQIKDRNGNFITINYNSYDTLSISTIVDTLGRTISFNYDLYGNLSSITQTWHRDLVSGGQATETHQWASFSYGTQYIANNFSGLTVYGPVNQNITVLTAVNLPDGSQYTFDYNNYGQVTKITCKRPYSSVLKPHNYVSYDLSSSSSDCPRLSARHDWAAYWHGDVDATMASSEETITYFGGDVDGARTMTSPAYGNPATSLIYKEYYGSGWQSGLVTQSEWWYGGVKQKWASTQWTQDNINQGYLLNPRVSEKNIYDASNNRRRMTFGYYNYTRPSGGSCALLTDSYEYAADAVTVYRRTHQAWELDEGYLTRGFIGLLHETDVYDGNNVLQAKGAYWYDYGGSLLVATASPDTPAQHDSNYNTSYFWRGNLSLVQRYDINDPNNSGAAREIYTGYNTSGSPVLTSQQHTAGVWRDSSTSYVDSFSDGSNHNTFAYPTTMTDAAGYSSTTKYNYDLGVAFRAQRPPPTNPATGQPYSQWAAQKTYYDPAGRIIRSVNEFNNAYSTLSYDGNTVLSSASINNLADEAMSLQYFDGQGRVFASEVNHPGSTGGYSGQWTVYDVMGRVSNQSAPTEVTGSWAAVGDDATQDGSLPSWTQQTYDWKGRLLRKTNPDGTYREASFSGCGCAGGEVVVTRDEVGRREKLSYDTFNRLWKTQVLYEQPKTETLDGNGTVYSTTLNYYDARDRTTSTRLYQGTESTGVYQETTMSYDGHGRLKTQHVPEQQAVPGNSSSSDHTTWDYNLDDTIQKVTDARGAANLLTYNSRNLVSNTSYTVPSGSGIPVTAPVNYGYDAAGNRISMNDGMGTASYQYDQLSRMTSETRYFGAPLYRTYSLTYGYNLANGLTTVGLPDWSQQVNYNHDAAGRLSSMTASGYLDTVYQGYYPNWYPVNTSVNTFASDIAYRASGAVKQMNYGNGVHTALTYNTNQKATSYQLSNFSGSVSAGAAYEYYDDGRIRLVSDLSENIFDRKYTYDHAGRLHDALTGNEARGGTTADGPFKESYDYDVWGNTTTETKRLWTGSTTTTNTSFTNNRHQDWNYDSNGMINWHIGDNLWFQHVYDAAGKRTRFVPLIDWVNGDPAVEMDDTFDGNALPSKRADVRRAQDWETGQVTTTTTTSYYLHSTPLGGQVVAELDAQGNKHIGYVYLNGMQLATETVLPWPSPAHSRIAWLYTDPVTGNNGVTSVEGWYGGMKQLDPLGADVTYPPDPPAPETYEVPDYFDLAKDTHYLIESGGPSEDFGIPLWYLNSVNKDFDRHMAELYWKHGFRDLAQEILARNPNVGITVSGPGAAELARRLGGVLDGQLSLWGAQAAQALGMVYTPNELGPAGEMRARMAVMGGGQQNNHASAPNGQLSPCLRDALRQFFPQRSAQGKTFSPIDDARFKNWIPTWVKVGSHFPLAVTPSAITLGLYDIHYDPKEHPSISSGNERSLRMIIEEVAHTEQFLQVWAGLKQNPALMAKHGIDTTGYESAKDAWQTHYLYYSVKAIGYDNDVEKWAQAKVENVMGDLIAHSGPNQTQICGFDLYPKSK